MPVDDSIVSGGTRARRGRLQLEWEWNPRFFSQAHVETSLNEQFTLDLSGQLDSQIDLDDLSNVLQERFINLAREETAEMTPVYVRARIQTAGVSTNAIVTDRLSGYLRYRFAETENRDEAPAFSGNELMFQPRHTATIGATWVHPSFLTLNAQAVYRSRRFADPLNAILIDPGWDIDLNAFWESPAKHWYLGATARNLVHDITGKAISEPLPGTPPQVFDTPGPVILLNIGYRP